MTDTRWNGEPCTARQITAIVADTHDFPQYWARPQCDGSHKAGHLLSGIESRM